MLIGNLRAVGKIMSAVMAKSIGVSYETNYSNLMSRAIKHETHALEAKEIFQN